MYSTEACRFWRHRTQGRRGRQEREIIRNGWSLRFPGFCFSGRLRDIPRAQREGRGSTVYDVCGPLLVGSLVSGALDCWWGGERSRVTCGNCVSTDNYSAGLKDRIIILPLARGTQGQGRRILSGIYSFQPLWCRLIRHWRPCTSSEPKLRDY